MQNIQQAEPDNGYQECVHFFNANRNVELCFVQSGMHCTGPNYRYGPLLRDHYLIHFVKSGKGRLYLHNQSCEVPAGHCFLIYPNQIAYYQADEQEPWEYYWLGLCGLQAESVLQAVGFRYGRVVMPFSNPDICRTILELTRNGQRCEADEDAVSLQMGGQMRQILFDLLEDNRRRREPSRVQPEDDDVAVMGTGGAYADRYVNIVAKLVQTSYSQNITVENIAEKLSMNRSYLSAMFKKTTGLTIKAFLTNYRIDQSCAMLRDRGKPITEISCAVGYEDPLYFSRLFRRKMGCSPTAYRQRM